MLEEFWQWTTNIFFVQGDNRYPQGEPQ